MADEHLSDAFIRSLYARVVQMEKDTTSNAEATARNTASIEAIRQNTQDIVDTFQALSGGFKVLQGLGRVAKPLAYVVGLGTAIITAYSAWRGIK
ncbi:hypothetical protein [Achromobacter sp. MFA1 R4]|uniref:hypothetical protein n=1 Tax=Achromobacter sp. MFA1 R4 TaxID=1881016 RepID=UPI0009537F4B|nr:hypothetical protein [Achromobacter sp. MFA1 R4]SIT00182.1 hypothetical protein SAMN05428937_0032 [Achromobacter sp. MFA1 R4]